MSDVAFLKRSGLADLAYVYTPAQGGGAGLPTVMFLGGYRSDMNGTKATALEQFCRERGQAFLRFDYSGHGRSGGTFEEGTIGQWIADARDVLDHIGPERVLLVGSSMGGWIALNLVKSREQNVCGLIGIAAAPDFTEDLYRCALDDAGRETLHREGAVAIANDYSDEPYFFSLNFYEEAKNHRVLDNAQSVSFPIVLLQGKRDLDVPWQTAHRIAERFLSPDFEIVMIEDGDHRLSRPEDLARLDEAVRKISGL